MNNHAHIDPEIDLNAQKRNSIITAVVISLLTILFICVIFMYVLLRSFLKDTPQVIIHSKDQKIETPIEKTEMNNKVKHKYPPPSPSIAKVITSNTQAPTTR